MIGEPKVRKERYIKFFLMTEVAMPIFSPIEVQTPKTCHSMKFFILYMTQIYIIFGNKSEKNFRIAKFSALRFDLSEIRNAAYSFAPTEIRIGSRPGRPLLPC